ncbi:uncharacterized protein [Asterias amurensis]
MMPTVTPHPTNGESTKPQEDGQPMMPTTIQQPTEDIGHDHRQDRVSQQPSSVHTVRSNQPPTEGQSVAFEHHSVGFLGPTSGVTVNQNTIPNVTDIGHDHQQDRVSQQPSNVHTVRPNRPPAEGQKVAFGHHSVGFFGTTSGVTVKQNTIPNVTDIGHDHRQDRASQQPSNVHTVRPNQPPAEGRNVFFEHHSVGFLGPTSGVTVKQNTIPNVTDIGHDHRQDRVSQQPSNVHTVRPNQPPAEGQSVAFEHHSVGFLGPTSGVTVNQNTIPNVTGTPDQE